MRVLGRLGRGDSGKTEASIESQTIPIDDLVPKDKKPIVEKVLRAMEPENFPGKPGSRCSLHDSIGRAASALIVQDEFGRDSKEFEQARLLINDISIRNDLINWRGAREQCGDDLELAFDVTLARIRDLVEQAYDVFEQNPETVHQESINTPTKAVA